MSRERAVAVEGMEDIEDAKSSPQWGFCDES